MPRTGYIEITNEMISEIKFHKQRTGVGPQKLLRGKRGDLPIGLSSTTIYNWINKTSTTGKKDQIKFTLKCYRGLPNDPDQTARNKNYKTDLEYINAEDLMKLKKVHELTGILPSKIFEICDDFPEYLNSAIVSNWLTRKDYKARPEDVEWVLKSCREILKRALKDESKHQ